VEKVTEVKFYDQFRKIRHGTQWSTRKNYYQKLKINHFKVLFCKRNAINEKNNKTSQCFKNLKYAITTNVDGLTIITVNKCARIVGPLVTSLADNLAFSGLHTPTLTVTAVDVIIVVYLTAAITEIFENSLTIFCFSSALICSVLQKRKAFALSLSPSSPARQGSNNSCYTLCSCHSFVVLPNFWNWNDFCGTLTKKT
jgi:hypothetical protein